MTDDRIAGTGKKNLGGKAEEFLGGATGNASMQAKGKLRQAEGTAQDLYGQAKDTMTDAAHMAQSTAEEAVDVVREFVEKETVHHRRCNAGHGLFDRSNGSELTGVRKDDHHARRKLSPPDPKAGRSPLSMPRSISKTPTRISVVAGLRQHLLVSALRLVPFPHRISPNKLASQTDALARWRNV